MDTNTFKTIVDGQLGVCRDILAEEAMDRVNGDQLHPFKMAASLVNKPVPQVLAGMMIKHTVKLYEMLESSSTIGIDVWTEEIAANINYLLLLKAVLTEEAMMTRVENGPPKEK